MAAITLTYYLEVISSWCHWSEPTWLELKQRYEGQVAFQWRIALMNPGDFPASLEQCDWFYRRSGSIMRSPYKLNSGWWEASLAGDYTVPNLVTEAGRDFSVEDDRLRLALSRAAVIDGRKIGRWEESIAVGSAVLGVDRDKLESVARSAAVRSRVEASTKTFLAHQLSQRPAFVLESVIGDKAVFSGLVRSEPIATTIEAMLADVAAYASHRAHFGTPPAA